MRRGRVFCAWAEKEVYTNRVVFGVAGVQRDGLQVKTAVEIDRCNDIPCLQKEKR